MRRSCRVLEEVKEGKIKFLRTVAIFELSKIPRAVHLRQSLTVSVTYKPSDLKFIIMSQGSLTSSLSPPPIAVAENLPFKAL